MKFSIIGVSRQDKPIETAFYVAYREINGGDAYFMQRFNQEFMATMDSSYIKAALIDTAYKYGGIDLEGALAEYFGYHPVGWTTEGFNIEYSSEPDISFDGFHQLAFPTPTKAKITINDPMHMQHVHVGMDDLSLGGIKNSEIAQKVFAGAPKVASSGPDFNQIALLPGLKERVDHPLIANSLCYGGWDNAALKNMIIHLNDDHKWTREEVADWLETLDIDLRFKSPDDTLREEKTQEVVKLKEGVKALQDWATNINAQIAEKIKKINLLEEELDNEHD